MEVYNHSVTDSSIVSNEMVRLFRAMNFAIICQAVDIFGVVANTINIIVFVKLGFKDSVNISLLGLAVSDLCACLTLVWLNISLNPWFQELDLPFDPNQMHYLTGGWPHVVFTRITSVITAFITLERCLCVTLPLKVKHIITHRRVSIFLITTYIVVIACFAPVYYSNSYALVFYPHLNKSLIGLIFTDDRAEVEAIHYPLISIFFPLSTFFFISVCTALLVTSLRRQAKWRQAATTASKTNEISTKEKKISIMVATISIVFIVCFFPIIMITFGMLSDREFSIDGKKRNLFDVLFSFSFILESVNSSLNIFIYYHKSSNYRKMFDQIFRRKGVVDNKS